MKKILIGLISIFSLSANAADFTISVNPHADSNVIARNKINNSKLGRFLTVGTGGWVLVQDDGKNLAAGLAHSFYLSSDCSGAAYIGSSNLPKGVYFQNFDTYYFANGNSVSLTAGSLRNANTGICATTGSTQFYYPAQIYAGSDLPDLRNLSISNKAQVELQVE